MALLQCTFSDANEDLESECVAARIDLIRDVVFANLNLQIVRSLKVTKFTNSFEKDPARSIVIVGRVGTTPSWQLRAPSHDITYWEWKRPFLRLLW